MIQHRDTEKDELANALYQAWPFVIQTAAMLNKAGILKDTDHAKIVNIDDVYNRIAIPLIDSAKPEKAA